MQIGQVQRILVLGAGRIGHEVAVQCAVHGYCTTLYDIDAQQLQLAASRQQVLLRQLVSQAVLAPEEADAALTRIRSTSDPAAAGEGIDLVSESTSERLPTKREVFRQFHQLCPPEAVFTTNSSYHLPSTMARYSGRPARFAALHFHAPVWYTGVVDIMPHAETSPETITLLTDFARRIGQLPIVLGKENHGYVFNAMLRPLLMSALTLAQQEVASVEDIDRSWMAVTKMGTGPFGMLDSIGLDTAYDVASYWGLVLRDAQAGRNAQYLRRLVEAGRRGVKSGHGFYRYPDPAFSQPGFLAPGERTGRLPRDLRRSPGAAAPSPVHGRPDGPSSRTAADTKQRMVLRMVAAPFSKLIDHAPQLHGSALILGDNPAAMAVGERLRQRGGQVVQVPRHGSDPDILGWLESYLQQCAAPHLFLMAGCDEAGRSNGGSAPGDDRYRQGVWLPYWVCQRWFSRLVETEQVSRGTLVAATALGGDFGISGRIDCAEGGGIAGLAKAVFLEAAAQAAVGPQVKVVDLPSDTLPGTAADWVLREFGLAQASVVVGTREETRRRFADLEIGYPGGERHAVRVVRAALEARPVRGIAAGSVWLVTGGARGISAEVARHLGQRFGLRLHLLSRSPLPQEDYTRLSAAELAALKHDVMSRAYRQRQKPNEAWERIAKGLEIQRSLQAMAAAGVRATYHAGDVANREELDRILGNIRRQDGAIQGILHGAGVEVTCRFARKQPAVVEATLAAKYRGALALMELTRDDPLEYFLAFGSLSGRFGGIGQTDYAMANDLLAKQMVWFRAQRRDCVVLTIHWPGWDEVGMAARPASRAALERSAHPLMPPAEGIGHLLNELAAGGPDGEVVIVDRRELPPELLVEE